MKQSENLKTLLESLAKAQAEFPTLPKDKNGYNYKYTDLDTVISTLRPILSKHNIGFMQSLTTMENGKAAITTRLFDTAGDWMEDTTPLPDVSLAKGNAAQNLGAAITYMKRYTLCAMLGVSCDEDPDGKPDGNPDFNARNQANEEPCNQGEGNDPQSKPQNKPGLKGGPDSKEEHEKINKLLGTKGANGNLLFTKDEVSNLVNMRKTMTAKEVITWLVGKIAERNHTPENFTEDIPWQQMELTEEQQKDLDAIY